MSSGFTFDEETYKKAKPLFEQAAQKFSAFMGDTRELVKRMVAHMRDTLKWPREVMERMGPYLKRFMSEIGKPSEQPQQEQPRQRTERREQQATETEHQVTYTPKSKAGSLDTLVPVNMRRSIDDALNELESRVGPIDDFVAKELKYKNAEALEDYFGAEQIDALGLAIDNIKNGKGFIIGDQTGIGKGRVNAAIIRWAFVNDRIPVFMTEKPGLYADMYRDLTDIGIHDIMLKGPRILATNSGLSLPLTDDAKGPSINTEDSKKHNTLMSSLDTADVDGFRKKFDMVFTTYNQTQTVKGEDTVRRQFLQAIIPNSTIIMDESHNAGGQKQARVAKGTPLSRSGFARDLVQKANGVFYSSATYAKRPDVMDLYSATDMSMAVDDLDHLAEAIQRGGVPMQQVVATMLAEAGQYIRRERSFDGIDYNTPAVEVDRKKYNQIANSLSAIQDFSKDMKKVAEERTKALKAEGAALGYDNATGDAGASSTNFTAIMHNIIDQMLLAMKVDGAADLAIAAIKRDEKPVITVAGTMESFLSEYVDTLGLNQGDPVGADFSQVLHRYLDRTRTLIQKIPFAEKGEPTTKRYYVPDNELGAGALAAYNRAKAIIDGMDLSDLPISPIDYLKGKLQKAGYRVGEITGRSLSVDYTGEEPVLSKRPGGETTTKGRNATRAAFNKLPKNGGLDAIIINQAGSTGISMHASDKFEDKRKRRMIIAQAEGNIDTHMQLLGRVNRTGQVVLPSYDQLVATIPAELRPAANLAKKMASLNANTTANRSSAVTAKDVPDFLNEYGDLVAAQYISDNLEMNYRLAYPIKVSDNGKIDREDAMRKLTGRIPLLPLEEQEAVYKELTSQYEALIKQLEEAGENALEAKSVDLKARTVERSVVQDKRNDSGSPFAAPVVVERVSVVRPGKPYTAQKLMEIIGEALGGTMGEKMDIGTLANMLQDANNTYGVWGREAAKNELAQRSAAIKDFTNYTRSILDDIDDGDKRTSQLNKFNAVKDRFETVHKMLRIGTRVTLKMASGNMTGIVIDVAHKGDAKNPLALSTWRAVFAVPDATRTMTLPFSRMVEDGKSDPDSVLDVEVVPFPAYQESYKDTLARFESKQTEAREDRYIARGNMLAAYDWLDRRGSIINYTNSRGTVMQGIMTPRDFDLAEHAVEKGKIVEKPEEVKKWLDDNVGRSIDAGDLSIERESRWSDRYVISVPKSKRIGGIYYLDKDLTDITGNFYSIRSMMSVNVTPEKLIMAIGRIQKIGGKFKIPAVAPNVEQVNDEPLAAISDPSAPIPQEKWEAVVKAADAALRHLVGDHAELQFSPGLMEIPDAARNKYGVAAQGSAGARGMYYPRRSIVKLAMLLGIQRALFHEGTHVALYKLSTPKERRLMASETANMRKYVAGRYRNYSSEKVAGIDDDEIHALAGEEYLDERVNGSPEKQAGHGLHIGVRRFFENIYRTLRRLRNAMNGLGFQVWEDWMDRLGDGEFANRKADTPRPEAASDDAALAALHGGPGGPDSFDNTIGDLLRTKWLGPIGRLNATEIRVQLQDKFIRVKKAEALKGVIPSYMSAYQAESLYYGRTGFRLEQLKKSAIDPLIEDVHARGLDVEGVNEFLYARHAQERNERIGNLHPAGHPFNDAVYDTSKVGASGMSTDEANDILNRIDASGKRADYDAIEARVRDLIRRTRDVLLNSGLITQETYDEWDRQYQFYVPLRGFADGSESEQAHMNPGRGFDTRGKEAQQAFGRKSMADGPLNYVLMQAEMAIVRAEKNRVGNTFLRFVQNNPDPDLWEVNKPTYSHTIDKTTGLITTMPDNFGDYRDPNVFITKVGGVPYRIRLKGPDGLNLARALNNMGTSAIHPMVRFMSVLTRTLARLSTSLNPEFTISNFMRDAGEAFVNMSAEHQRGLVTSFSKHLAPAMKGAMMALAGKGQGNVYADTFHEFDQAGGRIRFFGLEDADDVKGSVASKMRRLEGGAINNARDLFRKTLDGLEVVNGAVENATRLAAYMAAKDIGMSKADAAAFARELTVNFNRKGELGSAINALYMFANAAIQGPARMMRALGSRHIRKALAIMAAAGVATALYGILAGGDDEDGDSYYTKIPGYERDKNLIVMWPKGMGHDGQYVKIPLPFGYAVFPVIGSHMASMFYGKESASKAFKAIMSSVVNSFDPLGGDENLLAKIMPTIIRPAVHISTNENWTGKPLYPNNSYDKSKPDSQKSFRTNSEFSKAAAAKINEATGGSTYKSGGIDLHPATIDHWLETITGGLGRFAKGTVTSSWNLYKGEEWEPAKTPFVRRFYGTAGGAASDNAAYYETRQPAKDNAEAVARAKKDMRSGINVDESRRFIEENRNSAEANLFKQADSRLKKLRDQEARISASTDLPDDEKQAQVREVRNKIRDVQNATRARAKELREGKGQ